MFLSGMVGTASQKKYKITTVGAGTACSVTEASAGTIVQFQTDPQLFSFGITFVKSVSGIEIPMGYHTSTTSTRAAGVSLCFVMPAEDVTIS